MPHALAEFIQSRVVLDVFECFAMQGGKFGVGTTGPHRVTVAVAGEYEAWRDRQPGRDRLSQVRALATDAVSVGHPDISKAAEHRCCETGHFDTVSNTFNAPVSAGRLKTS